MTTAPHAHATDRKLTQEEIDGLRTRTKAFMESDVYPNEGFFHHNHPRKSEAGREKLKELQAKTKAMGMWAISPPARGGRHWERLPAVRVHQRDPRPQPVRAAGVRLAGAGHRQRRDPASVRHDGAEGAMDEAAR